MPSDPPAGLWVIRFLREGGTLVRSPEGVWKPSRADGRASELREGEDDAWSTLTCIPDELTPLESALGRADVVFRPGRPTWKTGDWLVYEEDFRSHMNGVVWGQMKAFLIVHGPSRAWWEGSLDVGEQSVPRIKGGSLHLVLQTCVSREPRIDGDILTETWERWLFSVRNGAVAREVRPLPEKVGR